MDESHQKGNCFRTRAYRRGTGIKATRLTEMHHNFIASQFCHGLHMLLFRWLSCPGWHSPSFSASVFLAFFSQVYHIQSLSSDVFLCSPLDVSTPPQSWIPAPHCDILYFKSLRDGIVSHTSNDTVTIRKSICFYLEVIVKWWRFSSPGRRFSAMPKWRRLRTNDGGLPCMYLFYWLLPEQSSNLLQYISLYSFRVLQIRMD